MSARNWCPASVISEGLSPLGRAGMSSFNHNAHKPAGCRLNKRTCASVNFESQQVPHVVLNTESQRTALLNINRTVPGTSTPRPEQTDSARKNATDGVMALGCALNTP